MSDDVLLLAVGHRRSVSPVKKWLVVVLLLLAFAAWGAWAIAGNDDGCTYSSERCGDPGWQNTPPYY